MPRPFGTELAAVYCSWKGGDPPQKDGEEFVETG
jgi:hypothetical protein